MDEPSIRSSVSTLRSEFRARTPIVDERPQMTDELATESDSAPGSEQTSTPARRKAKSATTANQFTGPLAPAQFKLPTDLLQSLKLHAIDSNETMSEIVLRCLTSPDVIEKAWISTRKAS